MRASAGQSPASGSLRASRLAAGLIIGSAVLVTVASAWIWPASRAGYWLSTVLQIVGPLLGGAVAIRRARQLRGRDRQAWTLLGAAACSYSAGMIAFAWPAVFWDREAAFPGLADIGYLLNAALLVAGTWRYPTLRQRRWSLVRTGLDTLAVMIAALLIGWVVVIEPVYHASGGDWFTQVVALAYPCSDVLIISTLLLLLRRAPVGGRDPLIMLLIGLSMQVVADTGYALLGVEGTYYSGHWIDAGWWAGLALIGAAATAYEPDDGQLAEQAPNRRGILLPYLISLAALLVLAGDWVMGDRAELFEILLGATVLMLLLARQSVVALDSVDLAGSLRRLTLIDELTGIANRRAFNAELETRLQPTHAAGDGHPQSVSVAMVDLDGFKAINDSLGHGVGDDLLIAAAGRLNASVRAEDFVARLGGDEFAVMMLGPAARGRGETIAHALSRPYAIGGRVVSATASVGTATASVGDGDADELTRRADVAMYEAKARGGRRSVNYDHDLEQSSIAREMLARDFTRALSEMQLVVYYQPIVRLADGAIEAIEALVRWRHPDRGLLGPDAFLGVAEATHSIVPLGRFVLREATRQMAAWNAARYPEPPIHLHVNLSAPELVAPDLIATVQDALRDSGLDPGCLIIEVTESALVPDLATAAAQMDLLAGLGAKLSLDDFGTGYSSLGYLHDLPAFSNLKIDRQLVSGDQPRDLTILEAIVTLAHNLDMDVIAEGIESQSQRDLVEALGCERGQGYLFGRPCDAAATAALLKTRPEQANGGGVSAPDGEAALAPQEAKTSILIVNDHLPTLEWLSAQLRESGYEPHGALTVQEGNRMARSGHPDLILIDLNMRRAAGPQLAQTLREQADTAEIPLVACRTSHPTGTLDGSFDGELGDLAGRSPAQLSIQLARFLAPHNGSLNDGTPLRQRESDK